MRLNVNKEKRDGKRPLLRLIVMASGLSRRFGGRNKLLLPWRGEPLCASVFRAVSYVKALYPDDIAAIAVSGYPEVRALAEERGLLALDNPEAAEGQSRSIRRGLLADIGVRREEIAVFLPADLPFLSGGALEAFCLQVWEGGHLLWRAFDGENFGSPTAFSEVFYPELLALEGDSGGRALFKKNKDETGLARLPAESLADIDTAEAWEEAVHGNL